MNLVHRWWDWCSESLAHTFAGVTAPLLLIGAFAVVLFYSSQGGGSSTPLPPRSEVAGVCVTASPGAGDDSDCATTVAATNAIVATATRVPPTPTPKPRTYTVRSGDSLYGICAGEVPEMNLDDCVGAIVERSGLGGPDEIFEGQILNLPPASGGTTATSATRPSATSTAVVAQPLPTSTPEPQPQASLTAIGPADVAPTAVPTEEPVEAEPTEEPVAATGDGFEYEIQAGDSLLGICVTEVPEMDEDECVEFVVLLNDLAGPDQIIEGQTIFLP